MWEKDTNKFVPKGTNFQKQRRKSSKRDFSTLLSHLPKFRNQALTKLDKVISDALHLDPLIFNLN